MDKIGVIMEKEFLQHIDEIHTTTLGEKRIEKNLKINTDVVNFFKRIIQNEKTVIYKKGKNYYVEVDNYRITINSYNYCIITAHII